MRFVLRSPRRYRQFDLADMKLLVEVRKRSSGVLQKEFRLEEQDSSEDVQKQQAGGDKNDVPVLEKAPLCRAP
jgi:hypothetical protein